MFLQSSAIYIYTPILLEKGIIIYIVLLRYADYNLPYIYHSKISCKKSNLRYLIFIVNHECKQNFIFPLTDHKFKQLLLFLDHASFGFEKLIFSFIYYEATMKQKKYFLVFFILNNHIFI